MLKITLFCACKGKITQLFWRLSLEVARSVTEFYNFLDVCVTSMDNTGKINIFLIPSEKIK